MHLSSQIPSTSGAAWRRAFELLGEVSPGHEFAQEDLLMALGVPFGPDFRKLIEFACNSGFLMADISQIPTAHIATNKWAACRRVLLGNEIAGSQ